MTRPEHGRLIVGTERGRNCSRARSAPEPPAVPVIGRPAHAPGQGSGIPGQLGPSPRGVHRV
ncbi:hypothetical protein SGL43_05411 [Streptomyces globisporus]|uniref:Uncharacterized protein n=1 Tax=Streptomyces globisporus TaxID=1908 RepID=A0ABN8V6G2_STRGL|nr:hypothetical protein SGL43_05411 [Streptomyces globisporus]